MSAPVDLLLSQLNMVGLPTPQTEVVFARPRRFRADLLWTTPMLIVEVDGGTWAGGRHTTGAGYERDCVKQAEATVRGYRYMKVTPRMIEDGRALTYIEQALGDISLSSNPQEAAIGTDKNKE